MSRIVLIDGSNILQKAFYSVPIMTDATGFHTNAIFGFVNILLKVVEIEKPDYLSIVFGIEEDGQSAGLKEQIPVLKELLTAMKIHFLASEEIKAADLLGRIVGHLERQTLEMETLEITLFTGERNTLQLASNQTKICLVETSGGKIVLQDYEIDAIQKEYQFDPTCLCALQVLTEIAQIGRKTAIDLLHIYAANEDIIAALYTNLDDVPQKSIREKLLQNKEAVLQNKESWRISKTGVIDFSLEKVIFQAENMFSAESNILLKKHSLHGKFGKSELENNTPTINIDKDIKVVSIRTKEDVQNAFDRVLQAGFAAIRPINVKAKGAGEFGAYADGQMYLQMDAEKAAFGCMLCGGSDNERNVYFIESSDAISATYLQQQIEQMFLSEKMSIAVFDIKNDYGKLFSEENDKKLSSSEMTKQLFDCKIAAYLINPLKSDYEIVDVADEYLSIALQRWAEIFGKTDFSTAYRNQRESVLSYLAKETYVLYRAKPLLETVLVQNKMDKLFRELEMPLTYVLFDMEREGILVRPEELKVYGETLNVRIDELEKTIHTAAGEVFNINSPKQLGEILFEKMKLPGGKKTKTGYSTAAEVLEKLAPENPIVKDILEYRGLTKLKSTYADGLAAYIDEENKIHTNFNQTITATGRLSSTEPNLQNIPMRMELGRRIRKVFVPQEGCIFMDADYSQIELRVLAHMSEDQQLIEAYKMDEDIHRITASKVFHTPFAEVTDLQRRNAKAVNFGIVYGISSFGLSQDLSITPKEAKSYIDEYFKTYPRIKKFLDRLVDDAKEKGYCETMFGRRRPVPELKSTNFNQRSFGERVAMNSPIQGTAADIIKYAMVHVYDALKEKGLQSKLILQIHDELLIETRKNEVEEVQAVLSQEMQNACELAVKLEIDLHIGTDWYEAK